MKFMMLFAILLMSIGAKANFLPEDAGALVYRGDACEMRITSSEGYTKVVIRDGRPVDLSYRYLTSDLMRALASRDAEDRKYEARLMPDERGANMMSLDVQNIYLNALKASLPLKNDRTNLERPIKIASSSELILTMHVLSPAAGNMASTQNTTQIRFAVKDNDLVLKYLVSDDSISKIKCSFVRK